MGWDAKKIEAHGIKNEIHITSFWGGAESARCLQLTQTKSENDTWDENHATQYVQLTEKQMEELCVRFKDWKSGRISEHEPHGRWGNK